MISRKNFFFPIGGFKTHTQTRLKKHFNRNHDEDRKKHCPYCDYKHEFKFRVEQHIDR